MQSVSGRKHAPREITQITLVRIPAHPAAGNPTCVDDAGESTGKDRNLSGGETHQPGPEAATTPGVVPSSLRILNFLLVLTKNVSSNILRNCRE